MANTRAKKDFQRKFSELRKLLNSYELIPDAPDDEFDSLNHQILSSLYQGVDFSELSRVLENELSLNYGLYNNTFTTMKMARDIIELWKSMNKI